MLYTFKSRAAANLIMLQSNAERVLDLIGKQPGPKGIITAEQMPVAIAALERALEREDSAAKASLDEARAAGLAAPRRESVSLRQRATPMLAMLKRCHKSDTDIVWGV